MPATTKPPVWVPGRPSALPGFYFYSLFGARDMTSDDIGACWLDAEFGWSESWVPPGRGSEHKYRDTEFAGPIETPVDPAIPIDDDGAFY